MTEPDRPVRLSPWQGPGGHLPAKSPRVDRGSGPCRGGCGRRRGALAVNIRGRSRRREARGRRSRRRRPANIWRQISSDAISGGGDSRTVRSISDAGGTASTRGQCQTLASRMGTALVASPRLPVAGVGPEDPWRLLTGGVTNWSEVGSAVPLPVHHWPLQMNRLAACEPNARSRATRRWRRTCRPTLAPWHSFQRRWSTSACSRSVGEDDPLDENHRGQTPVRIGVVGDIVPGRNVHLHMLEYGDFTRPFQRIASLLRSFDITVANLEGNLSETLPQPADPHSVSFVSSPAMLEGFALAGIDAVTLANNHSVWNDEGWGVQGLLDTIAALDSYGVPYFGAGPNSPAARAPWVVAAGRTRIAFLGIDGVTANYEVEPGAGDRCARCRCGSDR